MNGNNNTAFAVALVLGVFPSAVAHVSLDAVRFERALVMSALWMTTLRHPGMLVAAVDNAVAIRRQPLRITCVRFFRVAVCYVS